MNTKRRCRSSGMAITTSDRCPSRCTNATFWDRIAIMPTVRCASPAPKNIDAPGAVPSALTARPARSRPQPNVLAPALMWYVQIHSMAFIQSIKIGIGSLFQIKPLSGPIEGGTLVTIEGSNLGLKEEDVKGKIRIGDIPCELIDYQVSVKIICRTGPAPAEIDAPVIIGNTAGYTESTVKYSYKVRILSFRLRRVSPFVRVNDGHGCSVLDFFE